MSREPYHLATPRNLCGPLPAVTPDADVYAQARPEMLWSRSPELNQQPTVYKTVALPD